jgi:DNA-binding NtrC family response regulator
VNKLLRLAVIDDKEYWRKRLPVWLSRQNCEVEAYEDYTFFEADLKKGKSFDFTLGDYRIKDLQSRTGLEYLNDIDHQYHDRLGKVYIFTATDEEQVMKKYKDLGITQKFSYLNKKNIQEFMKNLPQYSTI